jgi:hypothetical protein
MGLCWYCYWGWPKQVADIYEKHLAMLNGDDMPMKYGPAHIVWSDENFGDSSINCCLGWCEEKDKESPESRESTAIVRASLNELLVVPASIRECDPRENDEDDPALFPTPDGLIMVRK